MARDGWKLLGDYVFDPVSGLWRHRQGAVQPPLRLGDVTYGADGCMQYPTHDSTASVAILDEHLAQARAILGECPAPVTDDAAHVSAEFDHLRWFDLPSLSLSRPQPR